MSTVPWARMANWQGLMQRIHIHPASGALPSCKHSSVRQCVAETAQTMCACIQYGVETSNMYVYIHVLVSCLLKSEYCKCCARQRTEERQVLQMAIIKHVLCETAKRLEHELQQVQQAANSQCGCVLIAYPSYLVNEDLRRKHDI